MHKPFHGIFEGLTVLVTGHTGFKGSWLSLWLRELGAHVVGYSLEPPTSPSNFACTGLQNEITHIIGDIRDFDALKRMMDTHQPAVVFHLAAQSLVLHSYDNPKETFDVNAGGTVNVLEAARTCPSIKAMVMVTTDKCYENNEWLWGYRENDRLGGKDPYSASKSMAELAVASYNTSFFKEAGPCVASARAGNVIGGGDFSAMRILPDCMKALMRNEPVKVRNPHSVRPWLNVLDPLSGYLWLAACMLENGKQFAGAWNFGPQENEGIPVSALVKKSLELWGKGDWIEVGVPAKAEMGTLRLNWDKAANLLKWRPAYNWEEAVAETVDWFRAFDACQHSEHQAAMREVGVAHIRQYTDRAQKLELPWAIACA